eukprot:1323184-Rhodomonas_salina.1
MAILAKNLSDLGATDQAGVVGWVVTLLNLFCLIFPVAKYGLRPDLAWEKARKQYREVREVALPPDAASPGTSGVVYGPAVLSDHPRSATEATTTPAKDRSVEYSRPTALLSFKTSRDGVFNGQPAAGVGLPVEPEEQYTRGTNEAQREARVLEAQLGLQQPSPEPFSGVSSEFAYPTPANSSLFYGQDQMASHAGGVYHNGMFSSPPPFSSPPVNHKTARKN